ATTLFLTDCYALPAFLSFPTRRSSDLWNTCWRRARRLAGRADPRRRPVARPPEGDPDPTRRVLQRAVGGRSAAQGSKEHHHLARSEEHTSELQSPDHLVCRLLLEKKKK